MIKNLLQQAKSVQDSVQSGIQSVQNNLDVLQVEGKAGNDAIKITMNCSYKAIKTDIDPAIIGDKEKFEAALIEAINDATSQCMKKREEIATSVAKGLVGLPPGVKLPFA
ncbi:MAG: YbaB/EbfC family nucleoid-associated protein [Azoarcus sp.]|jgi:DNA-binding YbaB/EbfC family protein|nr:YbaB/EbfC family nucleoid-associated protein [Azoarcus sp.]